MAYTNPTVSDFQAYFTRDFNYGTDPNTTIQDVDIQNAINLVALFINQGLFGTQAMYTLAFQYYTAHELCINIKASSQGTSGQYEWLLNSKAVGSVSVSSSIPDYILRNPQMSMLTKTWYGAMYLQIVFPYLVGPLFTVRGRTHA